jgi:hypothetical protein
VAPAFFRGQVARGNICPELGYTAARRHRPLLRRAFHDAFNLGMVLGGRGLESLLPLAAVWLSAAYGLWQITRLPRELDR